MADDTGTDGATPTDASTPDGATPDGQAGGTRDASADDAAALRAAGKAALDKERDARREAERRATDAERRLNELEDAGKSEVERAIARLDRQAAELDRERTLRMELEEKLAERDLLELKRQVAIDAGIPLDAAHRLVGTDARSLKADAQRYLEERRSAEGSLGVGRGGGAAARTGVDMNQLIREASGRT